MARCLAALRQRSRLPPPAPGRNTDGATGQNSLHGNSSTAGGVFTLADNITVNIEVILRRGQLSD